MTVPALDVPTALKEVISVETNGYATDTHRALSTLLLHTMTELDYLRTRIAQLERQIPQEVSK